MFNQKGFSREQTDLFLKKVNFMENREYFFHKRKAMDCSEEVESEEEIDQKKSHYRPRGSEKENNGFFDKISSSCKLEKGVNEMYKI